MSDEGPDLYGCGCAWVLLPLGPVGSPLPPADDEES